VEFLRKNPRLKNLFREAYATIERDFVHA